MPRFFNVAGPNDPERHYTLPVLARLPGLRKLIDNQLYFVIHAPRQTGKTTLIKTLAEELTKEGRYTGIAVSMESGAGYLHDPPAAELAILSQWRESALVRLPPGLQPPLFPDVAPFMPSWMTPGGTLNKEALLLSFLQFWRQHGEALMGVSPYHEAAPHLVLMAFLHRVVNGGGVIEREYAAGMGRMDICVRYGGEVLGIEVKVWRDGRKDPEADGLAQLDGYLGAIGQESGWLLIFDRRKGLSPVEERLGSHEGLTPSGKRVAVVRA